MKILVTGAAGFIGSHLTEKLLQRGDIVIGLDNFNDYYDPAKKRVNEQRLLAYPSFKMIEADIRDREYCFELFERERFDVVAHLAAMAGVRNAIEKPDLYIQVNCNGSQNLMDAARTIGGIQNFVCASTSSVYGNTTQIPYSEDDSCDTPLQPYAVAKRAVEMLGHAYYRLYGLNFTATRFFTVYGPRNRPDMFAFLAAESVQKGKQIPLHDGGEGIFRDWTYVDDIVNGLVLSIDQPLGYEVLNLGRGEPVLLKDFVTILEQVSGQKANVIATPRSLADVNYTFADISKARKLIGYNPKVSIKEGIHALWQWYIQENKAEANMQREATLVLR